jgi:hypothetical protein
MIPDYNRPNKSELRKVRVGGYIAKKLCFDNPQSYMGLLHGFSTEDNGDGPFAVAIVEKSDGTFDTPSVTIIQVMRGTTAANLDPCAVITSTDPLTAPFALFDGVTYYPAPGWTGHRGQYATLEAAVAAGQKYAEEQYGWWQVVDLRTLKVVAGGGSDPTLLDALGIPGACPSNPSDNTQSVLHID